MTSLLFDLHIVSRTATNKAHDALKPTPCSSSSKAEHDFLKTMRNNKQQKLYSIFFSNDSTQEENEVIKKQL